MFSLGLAGPFLPYLLLYLPGCMQKKLILDTDILDITINRLCQELIENHGDFGETVIIGMQPRGLYVAEIIHQKLQKLTKREIPFGFLDATFHRDDFRRRDIPAKANETRIDFAIEGKKVVLVDDVLFTGRTIKAALDVLLDYGRPARVELCVLADRKEHRQFPIEAGYKALEVPTDAKDKVKLVKNDAGKIDVVLISA